MSFNKYSTKKKQRQLVSKEQRNFRRGLVSLLKIVLVLFMLGIVVMAGAGFGMIKGILDDAPDISTISIKPKGFKTVIYDQAGNEIDTLSTVNSNRIYVYYDDIPKDLVNAFVAIEDERFWTHNGIDMRGIFRAGAHFITTGRSDQGASTITQQLIKNSVFDVGMNEDTSLKRVQRKIQEQKLAIELEKLYSKEQIMEYYLNIMYLGHGVNGVEAASLRYFNKHVSELTLSEATVIAGITQNPAAYDPIIFPEDNAKRRKLVVDKMLNLGYIDKTQYDEIMKDDVYSRIKEVSEEKEKTDTYNSYYTDAIMESLVKDFMELYGMSESEAYHELYEGGYKVYSVQDQKIQKIVDDVINDPSYYPDTTEVALNYNLTIIKPDGKEAGYDENSMVSYFGLDNYIFDSVEDARKMADKYKEAMLDETKGTFSAEEFRTSPQPQATCTVIDQHTGYIKAVCGGRGPKTANLSFDRATDAMRQPGSCFKVLAAFLPYIETKGSLACSFEDAPYAFSDGTEIKNWYSGYKNSYCSVRAGIAESLNIVAVKAITEATPEVAFQYLKDLGFTTLVEREVGSDGRVYSDITQSTALGGLTYGVTNLEITAAYASIANYGTYIKPVYYSKVYDHDGNLIIDNTNPNDPKRAKRVMKETTAWQLISAMKDVVNSAAGTGGPARPECGVRAAGKTGTTSSTYDLWFCGFTPYYTASIWTGYDSNQELGNVIYHKEMWADIMDKIYEIEDQSTEADWEMPDGLTQVTLCRYTNLLPGPGCDTYTDYCAVDMVPSKRCSGHKKIKLCNETHLLATNTCPNTTEYVVVEDPNNPGRLMLKGANFQYDQSIFEDPNTKNTCTKHPPKAEKQKIITSAGPGGTISPSVEVKLGSDVTIYIQPNSGYTIRDVQVDNKSVGAVSSYTFTKVSDPHTVLAIFEGGGSAGPAPTEEPTEPTPPPTEEPTEPTPPSEDETESEGP